MKQVILQSGIYGGLFRNNGKNGNYRTYRDHIGVI